LSSEQKVRVHIEYGDLKADFEGSADEVFKEVIKLLSHGIPAIETVSRLTYNVDFFKLMNDLAGIVTIIPDGPTLPPDLELSAHEAIGLCLLGAHIGAKLGKLNKDFMSIEELAIFTRKAEKTIRNAIPTMVKLGFIERTEEGEYRITTLGTKEFEDTIIPKLKSIGGEKK
jgi:hypothetical protein